MTCACLEIWFVDAVIFDLTGFSYTWGNMISDAITYPVEKYEKGFPVCIVSSELCDAALRSLRGFYAHSFPEGFEVVQSNLNYATEYILKYFTAHKED